MITEKNHKLLTSQIFFTDCTTKGLASMLLPLTLWVWIPLMERWTWYTTLCDEDCQWLATGRWFSSDTPVTSTNKTDRHDIAEILLKLALSTITLCNLYFTEQSCYNHPVKVAAVGVKEKSSRDVLIKGFKLNSMVIFLYII
jgi:hypothetical protein